MRPNHGMFSWKTTRLLFSIGSFVAMAGILRLVTAGSWVYILFVLLGLALVALSTRGPWDSEASGRNRSAVGFRVRQ
ncbi:hypothetical protein [Arthrobacter sp. lap29]|uniref:hypothetical protein n=1 Tax=Arthrobacter sp. lap29 TaxID=3056122 RepID=UPI0028F6EF5B|nr:hypothetical protein [Arthrobacter sp. lap29]